MTEVSTFRAVFRKLRLLRSTGCKVGLSGVPLLAEMGVPEDVLVGISFEWYLSSLPLAFALTLAQTAERIRRCEYCKVWLKDNPAAKAVHERGTKHTEMVEQSA